jgi:hypothetical protein
MEAIILFSLLGFGGLLFGLFILTPRGKKWLNSLD